jgi:hypothetical protein
MRVRPKVLLLSSGSFLQNWEDHMPIKRRVSNHLMMLAGDEEFMLFLGWRR